MELKEILGSGIILYGMEMVDTCHLKKTIECTTDALNYNIF